jgi:hypothetical protein
MGGGRTYTGVHAQDENGSGRSNDTQEQEQGVAQRSFFEVQVLRTAATQHWLELPPPPLTCE